MDPITTPEDVERLTRATVDAETIDVAAGIIELVAGRSTEVWSKLRPGDQRILKQATAYQAAWIASHPEAFTAMDVSYFQQLDQRVDLRGPDSLYLAPLAKRALKRLSWRGIRSVPLSTDFTRRPELGDHEGYWSPLP